jgi:hypothetical protein
VISILELVVLRMHATANSLKAAILALKRNGGIHPNSINAGRENATAELYSPHPAAMELEATANITRNADLIVTVQVAEEARDQLEQFLVALQLLAQKLHWQAAKQVYQNKRAKTLISAHFPPLV